MSWRIIEKIFLKNLEWKNLTQVFQLGGFHGRARTRSSNSVMHIFQRTGTVTKLIVLDILGSLTDGLKVWCVLVYPVLQANALMKTNQHHGAIVMQNPIGQKLLHGHSAEGKCITSVLN